MSKERPKTATYVLGFFVLLGILDSFIRWGMVPITQTLCNPGIALGISVPISLLWLGTAIFLVLAFARSLSWPGSASGSREQLAWRIIFIGGLVNAIDRWMHGCVSDYFHLPFFPSFNLADMMLFLGIVTLLKCTLGTSSQRTTYVS